MNAKLRWTLSTYTGLGVCWAGTYYATSKAPTGLITTLLDTTLLVTMWPASVGMSMVWAGKGFMVRLLSEVRLGDDEIPISFQRYPRISGYRRSAYRAAGLYLLGTGYSGKRG